MPHAVRRYRSVWQAAAYLSGLRMGSLRDDARGEAGQRSVARGYQFTAAQRLMNEFSFRQCLHYESLAADFRIARESNLACA
jgi:hypothetical protein